MHANFDPKTRNNNLCDSQSLIGFNSSWSNPMANIVCEVGSIGPHILKHDRQLLDVHVPKSYALRYVVHITLWSTSTPFECWNIYHLKRKEKRKKVPWHDKLEVFHSHMGEAWTCDHISKKEKSSRRRFPSYMCAHNHLLFLKQLSVAGD